MKLEKKEIITKQITLTITEDEFKGLIILLDGFVAAGLTNKVGLREFVNELNNHWYYCSEHYKSEDLNSHGLQYVLDRLLIK